MRGKKFATLRIALCFVLCLFVLTAIVPMSYADSNSGYIPCGSCSNQKAYFCYTSISNGSYYTYYYYKSCGSCGNWTCSYNTTCSRCGGKGTQWVNQSHMSGPGSSRTWYSANCYACGYHYETYY